MATKTVNFPISLWQDYTGASWSNLSKGGTWGGDDATYCTVQGSKSSSGYRPKSVFYHYQVKDIDSSQYKISSIKFTVIFGRKTKVSENAIPHLKVFSGDNNSPYQKSALYTTSSYKVKDNYYDFDTYTIEYSVSNVSIAQLKNVIFELDWSRTKTTAKSTVSINRAKVEVTYTEKNPKYALYNTLLKYDEYVGKTIGWKLTVKNTGACGQRTVTLKLPKDVSVSSSNGDGTYNPSTKTWDFGKLCKGDTATRYFYLTSNIVGAKKIEAILNSIYATNTNVIRDISFLPYYPPIDNTVSRDDRITYNFEPLFEKEHNQYFNVRIEGMKENHQCPTGYDEVLACYPMEISSNATFLTPISSNAELVDGSNVVGIESSGVADKILCLNVKCGVDFVADVKVYIDWIDDDTFITVSTQNNNGEWVSRTADVYPKRGATYHIDDSEAISRDKQYVPNSMNIVAEENWTIKAKSHRHNYFDEIKESMAIDIEEQIAYIGVVPLSRCHKADVTASSKNTLIENRYLNRAYYGKKGDYSEDIKMTLRIPWYDVATLQGLCEMDKPIPIDTIPYFPDGDPLNHRGWAEITGVTNIKKINDLYYECDVEVTYLNHDILTKFSIEQKEEVTKQSIEYYLTLIHNYTDDILDLFQLNFYEFWTTLEDAEGNKTGSYDIDPNSSLKMTRDLNKYSTYDIIWRNKAYPMAEDYDGNWEMALRVLDKGNNNRVLFEHTYTNFKHYDFDIAYPVNTADATSTFWNGKDYETRNLERIGLGFDELSPLIEDRKKPTHFNTMETTLIEELGDNFEIFLLDNENTGLKSKVVRVEIENDYGFKNRLNIMTDVWGRIIFDPRFGNGDYTIRLYFDEDEDYRSCSYETSIKVELTDMECHFEYPRNVTALTMNFPYVCRLLDENNNALSDFMLHYSFKEANGDYGYERTVVTDSNGYARIPLDYVNGTVTLRVVMKGFTYNNVVYQPVQFEEEVNINVR